MHYLELLRRANDGKKVDKGDWDYQYIVENVMELVDKYDLEYDPQDITPTDDSLFERLFAAGKELIVRTGVYYQTKGTIIPLSEQEIDEALQNSPKTLTMGMGADAVTIFAREIEDKRRPLVWAGNPGCPTPERLFLPITMSWLKEEIDLATCGSLIDVDGYDVCSGDATELLAVRRELKMLHEGLKRVGRDGMGMLAAESSVSEIGDLGAAAGSMFLRPCDSHLVAMFNELIIDRDNMIRAANNIDYGMRNAALTCTIIGGLGGGAAGSAVLMIASIMAANIVARADYHLCHPIHIHNVATSTKECMWLQSVTCQTFAKHAPQLIFCDIYPKSGALTKELLYEVAANTIAITVSGGHTEGVGSADGRLPHGTGLEVRLMSRLGRKVAELGITRAQASQLINALYDKYKHVFVNGNDGQPFEVAYDVESITPVAQWQQMYDEVMDEIEDMLKNGGLHE